MGTIAELAVNVIARTAQFEKGMGKSQKALGIFGGKASALNDTLGKLSKGPLFQATVAIGALGAGMTTSIKIFKSAIAVTREMSTEYDRLGKTADKLGLSSQSLVGLQFGAELAGIGPDKLATSIQRMARKIGDASRGMGEATKTFADLGLDVAQLKFLEADQQFVRVAESISKLKTHTERLSGIVKIFDSEGAELVRMLSTGAAGLAAFRAEADALGITISDKAVRGFENLETATSKMKAAIKGLKLEIATLSAPALTTLTNDLVEAAKAARKFGLIGASAERPAIPARMGRMAGLSPINALGLPGPAGSAITWLRRIYTMRGMLAGDGGRELGGTQAPPPLGGIGDPMENWNVTFGNPEEINVAATWRRLNAQVLASRLGFGLGQAIGATPATMFRNVKGLFPQGAAAVPAGYQGPNIGLRVGGLESQAARQRAKADASRVPEKQLDVAKETLSAIRQLIETVAGAGETIIEEITLT